MMLLDKQGKLIIKNRSLLKWAKNKYVSALVSKLEKGAYEAAIADPPDLVILDVMLPEMDGFEILKRLRAHPATASMAILMLTAKGQREDRERAIATGASQFISKPFGNALIASSSNQ